MTSNKIGVTERQCAVLPFIEDEVSAGRPVPNTVEIVRHANYSAGEVARILDALEYLEFITHPIGRQRNIRLCSPSASLAYDDRPVSELVRSGHLMRNAMHQG
jgi:hypothetical protein